MQNRKGEITTAQIVTIIVLIVSFIVILYFFFRLNLGATTNSEICHNSVVLQSKTAKILGGLQCKTDYVCISGGGNCENMNPTVTIKVDPNNKNETMKAIADQMANCWWMFGEGKLDYGDKGFFGSSGCALCSVVGFDSKVLDSNSGITYTDFYNYLANTKKDDTQTYLFYLYNVYDSSTLNQAGSVLNNNANNEIITDNKYALVTGFGTGWFGGFLGGNTLTPPAYLQTTQLSSELKCSSFITQS